MKRKQVISLVLVGAMAATLLAGCGSKTEDASSQPAPAATSAAEEATDAAPADEAEEAASSVKFDSLQEIDMYGMSFYGDSGLAEVLDEINKISEEAINVTISFTPMDVATYMEQIGLMLSGGEAFDLVLTTAIPSVSFSTMQSQNELMDITEYLPEYAPELMELTADYLPATTVNGKIYAVPCYRQYNSSQYLVMRRDVLEYLDLVDEAYAIDSYTDMNNLLQKVADAQDSLPEELQTTSIICNQDGQGGIITANGAAQGAENWADHTGYDLLGDSNKIIYVDEATNTVMNFFATDEYKAQLDIVRDWYTRGWTYKDAATAVETGDTLMMNDVAFCTFLTAEYGIEMTKGSQIGKELVCVESCKVPVQTYSVSQWCWAVPVTSENPEAAVAFMNLMYTNAEIENLFVYGIEGRDYEIVDGQASILDDHLYQCSDFFFGDQFKALPLAGNGASFRDEALASLNSADISPYLGFAVNTDPIANELTAVANTLNKYENGLESGTLDPAQLDTMLTELEASGINDVVAFYQEALDAWLAEQ